MTSWFLDSDLQALVLSAKLSLATLVLLILIGLPLSLWISKQKGVFRDLVTAVTALPLVLPPTVLGFYLLVLFSPEYLGQFAGNQSLAFRFESLVVASVISSLPFFVQPVLSSVSRINPELNQMAAVYGHGPVSRFFRVTLVEAKLGILAGVVLALAHTLGEFGVVLMIGGSVAGETKTLSIALFEHVEQLQFAQASSVALLMLGVSVVLVLMVSWLLRVER